MLSDSELDNAVRKSVEMASIEMAKEALKVQDADLRREALRLACGTNVPGPNGIPRESPDTLLEAANKFFSFMKGEDNSLETPKAGQ